MELVIWANVTIKYREYELGDLGLIDKSHNQDMEDVITLNVLDDVLFLIYTTCTDSGLKLNLLKPFLLSVLHLAAILYEIIQGNDATNTRYTCINKN